MVSAPRLVQDLGRTSSPERDQFGFSKTPWILLGFSHSVRFGSFGSEGISALGRAEELFRFRLDVWTKPHARPKAALKFLCWCAIVLGGQHSVTPNKRAVDFVRPIGLFLCQFG